jgi:large subunit ribosomal protein L25
MSMANQIELSAERRTVTGKKVNQLRRNGLIPAVVYGHNVAATSIQVDERVFGQLLTRAGMNRLIHIQLDAGEAVVALVRDIQREPISQRIRHIDFQAVSMTEPIVTSVPIVLHGEAPATDGGGILLQSMDSLEIRALPSNLISQVVVDVSSLVDFDAAIYVRDLELPGNVEVLANAEDMVAKVAPPALQVEEEEEEEGEAVELEGEEGAEPEVISSTEAERRRSERDEE